MNIIFLDLDGVLVHHGFRPQSGIMRDMDPTCVMHLSHACYLADAKVVVHSTWVHVGKHTEVLDYLSKAGFNLMNLHTDWICNESIVKEKAIEMWLARHPDTKYVVIDDERIGKHPQVQVLGGMFNGGFKEYHIEDVVKLLS